MLIVEFMQYRNVLCGRIVAMSDNLRDENLDFCKVFDGNETYYIRSKGHPDIKQNRLYLRGTETSRDEMAFSYAYDTVLEATRAKKAFSRMIIELNVENCYEYSPEIVGG